MDQEQVETTGEVAPVVEVVDLTGLEEKITGLVEVLEAEQEQKKLEAEKIAKEEAEAKKQAEEQAKVESENAVLTEQEAQEKAKSDEEHASNVMSLQESQVTTLDDILREMQTLNQNAVVLQEKMDNQDEIIAEGAFMITIAVIMSAGVKLLVEQLSKW